MCLKKIPFGPTIGELPTSYLMSMTYEEQLIWLCNYIQETILPNLEDVNNNIKEIRDYVDEYLKGFDEIKEKVEIIENTLDLLTIKINENSENITLLDNKINENIRSLNDKINNDINDLKNYSDYQDELIRQEIANIQIGEILIYNPTTGIREPLQMVVNDLYQLGNKEGLTASEFDSLELTAQNFDNYNITAYEFDSNGRNILV